MSIISLQPNSIGDVNTGFFTWDLSDDKVYADRAAANLFDLDERMAANGLPITCFLDRISPGDKARVAKSIHDAILSGNPYQESYRVVRGNGAVADVMAFGRCFRDSSGEPSCYAGIVFPKPNGPTRSSALFWHCLAAYELARRGGYPAVAEHLCNALRALECRTKPLVHMH